MSRADGYSGFVEKPRFKVCDQPREMESSLTVHALVRKSLILSPGIQKKKDFRGLDLFQLEDAIRPLLSPY